VIRIEDERRDALRTRNVRVRAREEEERAGETGGRDELLRAGDRPAVVVRRGARPQRARVRSRFGLGERERADHLSAGERRDEARALLVAAEAENRKRDGARVHGHGHADARVRARELFQHEDVGEEVRARTAVVLGYAGSHQAQFGELAEELLREMVLTVPLGRVRLDLGLRELARERLDLLLVGAQLEVHGRIIAQETS
jgi:hypothetical protein